MKQKYHVIIIGAGPAGLSTALHLQEQGVNDCLVVEKYHFPRYKCCAGYITSKTKKTYEELGLDLKECHYSLIKDFKIYYRFHLKQTIINQFLYTNRQIDRVELDDSFYQLACSKGISILEGTTITSHNKEGKTVTLANQEQLHYDYLVFADGTNSYGSRYQTNKKVNFAMQLIIPIEKQEEIQIHFGITQHGYAWVSSYGGVTNIGVTDVFNPKVNYKQVMESFLDQLHISTDLKNLRGTYTPIGLRTPILDSSIYFVGDAVGACDPLTLSGLRYALTTGEFCATSIAHNNPKIYQSYIRSLKVKFGLMQILLKLFYLKASLFCIFEIGCRCFGKLISVVFNQFFVNKK